MDIEQERQKLKATIAQIRDEAVKSALEREFEELAAKNAAAQDKAPVEADIEALQQRASQAVQAQGGAGGDGGGTSGVGSGEGFLTNAGFGLVIGIVILSFAFVFFYFWELGGENFTSPESIRPLLVLTLIIAMLGFGGLLMIRALFAPIKVAELQERFRLGREVFLVFSGIFGTIIGFYFGAEDEAGAGAPTIEIAFAEGRVTAAISEGTAPFLGIFTPQGQTGGRVMDADDRVLSLAIDGGTCPDGASIVVVDGRGRRADGTIDCDSGDDAPGDNTADNTVENIAAENRAATPPTANDQGL